MIIEDTRFVFVDEHHFTVEVLNLVRFQQAGNAAGQLLNNAVFELLGLCSSPLSRLQP